MPEENDKIDKREATKHFFAGDGFTLFAHKKAEKITSALYLVTNLLSDNEPIKFSLRNCSLSVLSEILPHTSQNLQARVVSHIHPRVSELLSFLGIAEQAGLVSEMNADILISEYQSLLELLQEGVEAQKGDFVLSKSFFDVEENLLLADVSDTKTHQNDTSKRHVVLNKLNKSAPKESASKRHGVILDLLRKKGEVTTTDIKEVIEDCSEKTIQRDIQELITVGKIVRHGKRRWARYTLA